MRSNSTALAKICGTAVMHFKSPISEAGERLIKSIKGNCTKSFGAASCHHTIELVRGAPARRANVGRPHQRV